MPREALGKLTKIQRGTSIAKRAGYMAGSFAAVDFIASDPETPTMVLEKESEAGNGGRDLATARIKDSRRCGAEGAALGLPLSGLGRPAGVAGSV